jgi:hypothetical protein
MKGSSNEMVIPRMAKFWRSPLFPGAVSEWTVDQMVVAIASTQILNDEERESYEKMKKKRANASTSTRRVLISSSGFGE